MTKLFLCVLVVARLAGGATPDKFVLDDQIDHPFIWWPQTLLSYPVHFHEAADLIHLVLTETGARQVPVQFSDVVRKGNLVESATVNFISDLPSHGHKEFSLVTGVPQVTRGVTETSEGNTIVLDSGAVRVRIPASREVNGDAPGPVQQLSRGGAWFGQSKLMLEGERITRIEARRMESGPLFITYKLTYSTASGGKYIATVRCIQGMDFVELHEDMEGLAETATGSWNIEWKGFPVSYRQAANHPYPFPARVEKGHQYNDYPWEPVDQQYTNTQNGVVAGISEAGELPFVLGTYEPWAAFHVSNFANFWNTGTADALGVFIDKVQNWQDHEYAIWKESPKLAIQFLYRDKTLSWQWPIARGSRSTCLTFYDHAKDVEAMRRVESYGHVAWHDGLTYSVPIASISHTLFLQNRHGTIDLNDVKDWALTDPGRDTSFFREGDISLAGELEARVLNSELVNEMAVSGTRQNNGFGPTVTRSIEGFWIDGFARLRPQMPEQQRRRLTAIYLFMAYVHAGEDYMPMIPMLSGHPNFLSDVKATPAAMPFLFPTHRMAQTWADEFEKFIELNTHYHTRPGVAEWDAKGGRWTENLGTYVWAFLRPALHADMLLDRFDQSNRLATPEMAALGDWLVSALSAPFNGESAELLEEENQRSNHEWGLVSPESGPRRVHLPIGAHAERRMPPRALWYLGERLLRFEPLTAEHMMWAARPGDQDMELSRSSKDPYAPAYEMPDNRGTNPHLRSAKYTGYGIALRAAVGSPDEISVHLQQIDEGPNYRWGLAGEGGTGVVYFFAGGKSYSFNGTEDVGDRAAQDTDFCSNFGVWKDSYFHSVGRQDLTRPLDDLGVAQFAEVLARDGYSSPEYVGRSILLAGHDYFVLYDDVFNEFIKHRLSWFVRKGEEFPAIQITRPRLVQTTQLQTGSTLGRWYDGMGDSMAIISARKDIQSEATAFGARVRGKGIDDLVFRDASGVKYDQQGVQFEGTAGIVRENEMALFHGRRIAKAGIDIETQDNDLGISAAMAGDSVSGMFYATHSTAMEIRGAPGTFYVDGARASMNALPRGLHSWEMSKRQPMPLAPSILRTENRSAGARVVLSPVASALRYRLQISRDNGGTWSDASESANPEFTLTGLANGTKIHVRAAAVNSSHASEPGPEYPIYVSDTPAPPPEGLHLSGKLVTWGEVLGVTEYRLYARTRNQDWRVIYQGLQRSFTDASVEGAYRVTAVNGNGEGPPSRVAASDPSNWRNFDPKPGEPFRRTNAGPNYYPKP